jgi:hypothetical protein
LRSKKTVNKKFEQNTTTEKHLALVKKVRSEPARLQRKSTRAAPAASEIRPYHPWLVTLNQPRLQRRLSGHGAGSGSGSDS